MLSVSIKHLKEWYSTSPQMTPSSMSLVRVNILRVLDVYGVQHSFKEEMRGVGGVGSRLSEPKTTDCPQEVLI